MTDKTEPSQLIELDGTDIYPNWDQLIRTPADKKEEKKISVTEKTSSELDISLDMLLDEKDTTYWQNLFNEMNFPGMDLMAVTYHPEYLSNPLKEHSELRLKTKLFLKQLSNENVNDLRAAGIAESSIFSMAKGVLPPNWTIHIKYPLAYGGTLDFENMVLIQCHPFHEEIHNYINKQILSMAGVAKPAELYVPVPVGKIYIPTNVNFAGGGGGKASLGIPAKTNGGR